MRGGASQLIDTGETRWSVRILPGGWRGSFGGATPVDTAWLLGLGDSFAFGYGVDHEDTFYARIRPRGLTIRNHAIPGHGPTQYRIVLGEHARDPSIRGVVVSSYLGNDFHDCIWDKAGMRVDDGRLSESAPGWRTGLKLHSHLYRALSRAAHALGSGGRATGVEQDLFDAAAWRREPLAAAVGTYRQEFERMRDVCRDSAYPFLVVLIPPASAWTGATARLDRGLPMRTALGIMDELGIAAVDVTEALARCEQPPFFRIDGHFVPGTHRAVAEFVESHPAWKSLFGDADRR
jgi:hypothetical protein